MGGESAEITMPSLEGVDSLLFTKNKYLLIMFKITYYIE